MVVALAILGYRYGSRKGLFLTLYNIAALIIGMFMFYRLSGLTKLLADKFPPSLVYSLGLLVMVLFTVLVFRLFLLIVYRFIDTKPALGSLGILAGIAGLIYLLLWASVLLKSLHYLNIEAVRNVILGSFSAKYILPLPLFMYKMIAGIGSKVFVLKPQS